MTDSLVVSRACRDTTELARRANSSASRWRSSSNQQDRRSGSHSARRSPAHRACHDRRVSLGTWRPTLGAPSRTPRSSLWLPFSPRPATGGTRCGGCTGRRDSTPSAGGTCLRRTPAHLSLRLLGGSQSLSPASQPPAADPGSACAAACHGSLLWCVAQVALDRCMQRRAGWPAPLSRWEHRWSQTRYGATRGSGSWPGRAAGAGHPTAGAR
jgi:hypothetical protein